MLDAQNIRFSQSETTTIVDGINKQLMGSTYNDKPAGERAFRDNGHFICVFIAPEQNHSACWVLKRTAMGDLVNLKRFKKRREREQSERQAETNRALHGRTKSQRAADDKHAARQRDLLDQHHIDGEDAS